MQSSDISYPEVYTQAEITKILELAFTRQINHPSSLTREQLWAMGTEFGLDLVSIQEAEQYWLNQQAIDLQRQEFNRYRRQEIINKVIRFALINSLMVILDLVSTHHLSWSIYLLLIWGLIFFIGLWRTTQPSEDEYEQAFQRWRVRQELKSSFSNAWEKLKQAWQNQNNDLEIN